MKTNNNSNCHPEGSLVPVGSKELDSNTVGEVSSPMDPTDVSHPQGDKRESGRSMVEMLGVLAIIGVLSIGGIAGYTMAMTRYKANQVLDLVTKFAIGIENSVPTYNCINTFSSVANELGLLYSNACKSGCHCWYAGYETSFLVDRNGTMVVNTSVGVHNALKSIIGSNNFNAIAKNSFSIEFDYWQ